LEFRFTALDLESPESCRFKYKLDDVDADWKDAGTRRTANYNNVYPGKYHFHVMACSRDGVWNEAGASLALVLQPHFWQTLWARALAALFVIGAAAGTARYVTKRRMQRKLAALEQRHAIERERGRIAKDIHDDLGSSLTRIMMLGQRAEEGLVNREDVGVHVNKIVASARSTVQAMDEIVWAVNPENDSVEGLIGYIGHYADEFFEDTNVRCRLEIPVKLPGTNLPAEVRHDLFLVVKEAFNNVLKHARASEVRVRVVAADSTLAISIEDNGCGFDLQQTSPSRNGLRNMHRRLEAHGGGLAVVSSPEHGTQLRITAKLNAGNGATA
jgi:signal transduction histidine kinase